MSQLLQGRYRREAVLGQWDAATTTLALDTQTNQLCVVKALRLPRAAGPDLVKLLKREARAYQRLAHPRIPKLLDAFAKQDEDGLTSFYLVQEHVAGRDLARVVREDGPMPEATALALMGTLLELLDRFHGHAPPLTHRSVKPENVVIGDDGHAHLIDFGSWSGAMRRLLGPEGQLAPSDGRGYGAPEQLAGRPVAASDVYALGATLLFALTGREHAQDPAGLTKLAVSRRLRRILQGMLQPELEARYANARTVLTALRAAPDDAFVASRAFAGGAAALAVAGSLFLWLQPKPPPAPAAAPPMAKQAQAAPPPPETQPPQKVMPSRAPLDEALVAVQARYGVLSIDVYRDFQYVAGGWPGGLSVGQTDASPLDTRPQEPLRAEPRYASAHPLYGYLTLGSGPDRRISFVLDDLEQPKWVVWIDKNNNQDLTDDGPPQRNQGTLALAATVRLFLDFSTDSGIVRRPYQLWLWVNELKGAPPGQPRYAARFYATCHYRGRIELEGKAFDAAAFEQRDHDGVLQDDGIWIDLDGDRKFNPPQEHFSDGEEIRTGSGTVRVRLASR